MNTSKFRAYAFLLALLLGVTMVTFDVVWVAAELSESEMSSTKTDSIAWAENVRDYKLGEGVGADFSDPSAALGEDDAVPGVSGIFSMGNALNSDPQPPLLPSQCEAYLIVDFGDNFIADGEGTDIGVFEVASNGVAEATWVYVGREEGDSELWLYAGQTGGSIEGVDISGVGDPDELFNLVALCDFPDGISSGSPVGGPDIDAIAALNYERTGLTVEADGPGWSKNEEEIPPGERTAIDAGDALTIDCSDVTDFERCTDADFEIAMECLGEHESTIFRLSALLLASEDLTHRILVTEVADELTQLCFEGNAQHLVEQDAMATFSIQEGDFRFFVEEENWHFGLDLPVAHVESEGANDFWIGYDSTSHEAWIRVSAGVVTIEPSAPGEDPFDLQAGQQVMIEADSVGPVIDLTFIHLPVVFGQ